MKAIKSNKEYMSLMDKFKDNQYKIMYAIEIYNEEVEVYNNYTILEGDKYTYFLMDNKLYRCSQKFKDTTLKLLEIFAILVMPLT